MKLLLDEMLSHRIARELQARGRDVESVNGNPQWEAHPDIDVLELARRERRAIATNNVRDFRPLHYEAVAPAGRGHFGFVFMASGYRRTKGDIGRIVAALDAVIEAHPGERDLADREIWL